MDNYMKNHIKKGTYDFLKKTVRNNTFSLDNSVKSIKRTIYNSYEYLKKLQLSYATIPKFVNISNNKIIFKDDMYPHLYINKDFIDSEKREDYRLSYEQITEGGNIDRTYYNKYIPWIKVFNSMKNVYSNNIKNNTIKTFTWLPLVFRNGRIDKNIEIKFEADGGIDIRFMSINSDKYNSYMLNNHNYRFDIIWFKNVEITSATVNSTVFSSGCNIPTNYLNGSDKCIFAFMCDDIAGSNHNENNSTGLYPCKKSSNKIIFTDPINATKAFGQNNVPSGNFTIYYIAPANMRCLSNLKNFYSTINGREAIVTIEKSNNVTYDEPIPKENILPFLYYQNISFIDLDAQITDHYPNIYEITRSEAIDGSYRIYYLYKELPDDYKYENELKYVYAYLMDRTNSSNIEECLLKFLTSNVNNRITDEDLLEVFNKYWNYKAPEYKYSNLDFWLSDQTISKDFYNRNLDNDEQVDDLYENNKIRDYDYLYKINKMQSIVDSDFSVLNQYGKETNIPFKSYYFNIRKDGFNLESRARYDTYTMDYEPGEEIPEANKIDFDQKHYLFKFRNEDDGRVYLNIFIDGKQVPKTAFKRVNPDTGETEYIDYGFKVIQHAFCDFIYIPSDYFDNTSTIVEIERLGNYKFTYKQYFTNNDLLLINFTEKEYMMPTLFDLFIVDENNERLSWTFNNSNNLRFDVYVKIPDDSQYAVEDHEYTSNNIIIQDNEYYISVNDLLLQFEEAYKSDDMQESLDLLPLKYIGLEKILIRCKDSSLYNKKLKILINKNPYTFTKRMTKDGVPKIKLYQGRLLWRGMISYIRTFLDGYYLPINYTIEDISATEVYLLPRLVVKEGEVIDFEISPYSYELEFYMKNIPQNHIIDFEDKLSRPFDFDYYDLYVNGLKFNYANITKLTPTKIRIENLSDKYNIAVYRRDKDYEYYIKTNTLTPTDDVVDKGGDDVIPPTPPGPKGDDPVPPPPPPDDKDRWIRVMSEHDYQYYMFYLNKIIPRGVTRGNDWDLEKAELNSKYPIVYNNFSNKVNRIVMRPNKDHELKEVLKIGRSTDLTVGDINYIIDEW